ncbi:signal peptide peptidase SppA [bacterium]|nr:signal peptide peptidase SppA [bacterium]
MRSRLFVLIALVATLATGCISLSQPFDRGKLHREIVKQADHWYTTDQVLLIPLSGVVTEGSMRSYLGEPGMLIALKDRLDVARKNKLIKAVVIRIDSPGGTITAADLIYHEIVEFKKETKLPVVAILGDTAASGGLYVAMAADEVYALPTTLTGSIGVIIQLPGIKRLSDKVGVEMRTIKSGPHKDLASMWNEMSPDERAIFQKMIDQYYARFLGTIIASRAKHGLEESKLRAIADGRVFSPEVAVGAKLIDGIKYPEAVYDRAKGLADIKDAEIISYEYPNNYRGNIYARANDAKPTADVNLINIDLGLGDQAAPHFLYMWKP